MSRFRETEHPARRSTRFHWAAGLHPGHWVVGGGMWLAALLLGATTPFVGPKAEALATMVGFISLAALGWSGIWLLVMPSLPRFRRAVDARLGEKYAGDFSYQISELRSRIDRSLSGEVQDIVRLRDRARDILDRKGGDFDVFARENLAKLDTLAIQYLRMLVALTEYDQYVSLVNPESILEHLEQARAEEASASGAAAEARAKTVQLLESRLLRYRKASEQIELLKAQIKNVEATMKLLVDQAMTAQDAQSVRQDIDEVLANIESSEVLNQELSALNELDADLSQRLRNRQ
ncbi:hypothetical protein IT575_08740 [bacterium]|nr:hypothetical protein [bacterium]